MTSQIYFMDMNTNQELVGWPKITPNTDYTIEQQLTAHGQQYMFAFADITTNPGTPPELIYAESVPSGSIAYLWYMPPGDLPGANPPTLDIFGYDSSAGYHKFVNVNVEVTQGGATQQLTTGIGFGANALSINSTEATEVTAPGHDGTGAAFRAWYATFPLDLAPPNNPLLSVPTDTVGSCGAVFWSAAALPRETPCEEIIESLEKALSMHIHLLPTLVASIREMLLLQCSGALYEQGLALLNELE